MPGHEPPPPRDRRTVTGSALGGCVVRLADPPSFLAGREDLLAELDARLAGGSGSGPRTVALCGLGARGRPAWRWSTRTVTWLRSGWPGSLLPRTRWCWRPGSASWQPSSGPGTSPMPGPGGVGARSAGRLPGGVAADLRQRAGPGVGAGVPAASRAGRVVITSRNRTWPPGQALEVPALGTEVAAGFLAGRAGDPDRQAAAILPVSWAGCRWRWSRPPGTWRPPGAASPGTWPRSGSCGQACWAAAGLPGTARRW